MTIMKSLDDASQPQEQQQVPHLQQPKPAWLALPSLGIYWHGKKPILNWIRPGINIFYQVLMNEIQMLELNTPIPYSSTLRVVTPRRGSSILYLAYRVWVKAYNVSTIKHIPWVAGYVQEGRGLFKEIFCCSDIIAPSAELFLKSWTCCSWLFATVAARWKTWLSPVVVFVLFVVLSTSQKECILQAVILWAR